MFKKWALGMLLMSSSLTSNAALMSFDTTLTGADMAGLEVVATFNDLTTETLEWQTISTILGTSGNDIIDHEGYVGGVSGANWSLTQQGYTGGNFDGAGGFFGAWSFVDSSQLGITKLEIFSNDTNIFFDTSFLTDLSDDSNGSGQGREFIAYKDGAEFFGYSLSYGDNLVDELYGSLTLDLTTPGTSFNFLIDTDKLIDVPEPSSLVTLVSAVIGLMVIRRRKIVGKE
ncbi:PEP-CTERM sorting domain-containing protein [Catenovulum agarivorans]|uniref:PEP-CTERM sorting domain-containing protein n=1 Tax=Catenovulum agarivorans TaxID=1172192 RepID=UPI0012FC9002|nr:PEP-CTERM sorting domain-containing protein [Catenovulum agarivorans]